MKIATHLVAGFLGLAFIAFGLLVLLNLAPAPQIPEGTPPAHFFAALGPTGYLKMIKIFEVVGGLLTIIPATRRLGIILLGAILINILAFHQLVAGDGIFQPILLVLVFATLFLVWADRRAWIAFLTGR